MADPFFKNNNFTKRPFFLELNYLYRDLLFFSNLGENWYEWQTLFTYFIYSRFALQRYKLLVCIMRQIRLF